MNARAESICTVCGICCDGTLFSYAPLNPKYDDIAGLRARGLSIRARTDGSVILRQSCAALKDCACAIYQDRPRACRNYRCALLRKFDRTEISREAALGAIRQVKSAKQEWEMAVLAAYPEDARRTTFSRRMRLWAENPTVVVPGRADARLFLKFLSLQRLLDRFFRSKGKRVFGESATTQSGRST